MCIRDSHRTVRRGEGKLLHDALDFVHRVLRTLTLLVVAKGLVDVYKRQVLKMSSVMRLITSKMLRPWT